MLFCAGDRHKVTVADEDIVGIVKVIEAFPEICFAGICIVGPGNGICHFAGGVNIADKDVRNGGAAFHAALPSEENALNLFVFRKIFAVYGRAGVDNNDDLGKKLSQTVDKLFFKIGKIIVSALRSAVNALCREAAQGYDGCICPLGSGNNELIGNLCFNNVHCGKGVVGKIVAVLAELHIVDDIPSGIDLFGSENINALCLNVVFVEIDKGGVDLGLAFFFLHFEAFVDIADVGGINISAAAAAFYVFDGCLAEKSYL